MAKGFRPVRRDQPMLLPEDMHRWLPDDHLAWFVLDTVDMLDTAGLEKATSRRGGAGAAGFDPRMLLALLIYAYCQGVRSSRQVERLCVTDVAFRVLCAQDRPDHATIARFRVRAGGVFTGLFAQVLMIAAKAGLATFGTVAIDGTKIEANASINANRGRDWFDRHAAEAVSDAQRIDQAEDRAAAEDGGQAQDRVPVDLADRTSRRCRIARAARELKEAEVRAARADTQHAAGARDRLERANNGGPVRGRIPAGPRHLAEARAHLARQTTMHQAKLDRYESLVAAGKKPMGRPPVPMGQAAVVMRARKVVARAEKMAAAEVEPKPVVGKLPKIVANTTDPDSRIMPTRRGFVQGYNVQVAVTADQLIAVCAVGQSSNDQRAFIPMMHAAQTAASRLHAATGEDRHVIGAVLADAGYNSNDNLTAAGPDRLIALGKGRDQARTAVDDPASGPPPPGATPRETNAHRLRTPEGRALYKRRGATVEPGIGNLKKILGRFSRRGLENAHQEVHLAATAFNIMKIYRATTVT